MLACSSREVNQRGYDVVSSAGERILVKTTAIMDNGGHVAFNSNSLEYVDRVMILRMNTEEMQIEVLLDAPIAQVRSMLSQGSGGKLTLALSRLLGRAAPVRPAAVSKEVEYAGYTIRELENGTIEIARDGQIAQPVKPVLRELAVQLNVGLLNSRGNTLNTRSLGTQIIQSIKALQDRVSSSVASLSPED